eukprot:11743105-Prorocentrum_lima.AAC.1
MVSCGARSTMPVSFLPHYCPQCRRTLRPRIYHQPWQPDGESQRSSASRALVCLPPCTMSALRNGRSGGCSIA